MHLVTLNVSDKLSEIDSVLSLQRDELETGGQTSTDLTQAWWISLQCLLIGHSYSFYSCCRPKFNANSSVDPRMRYLGSASTYRDVVDNMGRCLTICVTTRWKIRPGHRLVLPCSARYNAWVSVAMSRQGVRYCFLCAQPNTTFETMLLTKDHPARWDEPRKPIREYSVIKPQVHS
jgi:hypothetical protein